LRQSLKRCVKDQDLYTTLLTRLDTDQLAAFIDQIEDHQGEDISASCAAKLIQLATALLHQQTPTLTVTPSVTPSTQHLSVRAVCSSNPDTTRLWQVSNPGPDVVAFTWNLADPSQQGGAGVVLQATDSGSGVTFVQAQTESGNMIMQVYVGGFLQDSQPSTNRACATATPSPTPSAKPRLAPTFVPSRK
jgi:hypothetical protein